MDKNKNNKESAHKQADNINKQTTKTQKETNKDIDKVLGNAVNCILLVFKQSD